MAAILADVIFKCIFFYENDRILNQMALKLVPNSPIDNKSAEQATSHYLNQWWPSSLTHICGIRGRWVNAKVIVLLKNLNISLYITCYCTQCNQEKVKTIRFELKTPYRTHVETLCYSFLLFHRINVSTVSWMYCSKSTASTDHLQLGCGMITYGYLSIFDE